MYKRRVRKNRHQPLKDEKHAGELPHDLRKLRRHIRRSCHWGSSHKMSYIHSPSTEPKERERESIDEKGESNNVREKKKEKKNKVLAKIR